MIEDVLDPNRNVDTHFYVHVITKKDGSVVAGVERGEIGQVLVCVDATGQEQRLPKSEIAGNQITAMSLMPAAFGQSIPEPDFHDLVAYLLDSRPKK